MAQWIRQTLSVNEEVEIVLCDKSVIVGTPEGHFRKHGFAFFTPLTREEANAMSVSLRLAAKRLEEIGKGLD